MQTSTRKPWPDYAMGHAILAAEQSEDPYVKVGSCALRKDHSIAGVGYNGAPPNVEIDWSNRDERRKRVIHSEINCCAYFRPGECTLLSCTHLPCLNCLTFLARYGFKDIFYKNGYTSFSYGSEEETHKIAKEFGINLQKI